MKSKAFQTLFFLLASAVTFSATAQTAPGKIHLNKGQKVQVDNTITSVISMEMMGQSMEMNSDGMMLYKVEVKDKKDTSYNISSTLTKMTNNGSMMGQSYSFDSDKKKDLDSTEMGKAIKKELNVAKEIELNNSGQQVNQKMIDISEDAGQNPMMGMMKTMSGAGAAFSSVTEIFQALPAGAKNGDSWVDSSIADGLKSYRSYTIKDVTNNIATITITGNQIVNKTLEQMGSAINLSMQAKLSGEAKIEVNSGVVQQKNFTMEGAGNADAMGQTIPLTMKVTSITNVKNL
jgi:hypothetical protein